jgi:hypothetical protein
MKMIGHQAPGMNDQSLVVNKVIKGMYYHLFVHRADKYIHPINCIESDKITGLPALYVIVITHITLCQPELKLCFSMANAVPIMKIC